MRKGVLNTSKRKTKKQKKGKLLHSKFWANLAEPHGREWEEFWEEKGSTYFLNTA